MERPSLTLSRVGSWGFFVLAGISIAGGMDGVPGSGPAFVPLHLVIALLLDARSRGWAPIP